MTVTTNVVRRDTLGGTMFRVVDLTLDNSYPTGGWAITPQMAGFGTNGSVIHVYGISSKDGYSLGWDEVNKKLKVFQGDNTNAASAPGVELPNASAVMNGKVVRALVIGYGHG